MLTIRRAWGRRLPRRDFLQLGLLAPLGLSLPMLQEARARSRPRPGSRHGRARQCILVFLNGGPSQLDTFDMKPAAEKNVRGELKPIATNVPGIQVSELLPRTARHADKFKIVRSVTHEASVHTTAVYTMLTGTRHPTPKMDQTRARPDDHPHLGSIFGSHRGWKDGIPPFVTLPMLFTGLPVDGVWAGQTAGFLGRRHDPLIVPGEKETARFSLPAVQLPADLTAERLASRRALQKEMDRSLQDAAASKTQNLMREKAYELLGSSGMGRATDLSREPESLREQYGRHLFGQGLLLSRRLIEAGVPLVTVYWIDPTPPGEGGGEFDSHGRIYHHMRNRLMPPADRALAALFGDLSQRGLLDETLVVVMSEFGRSPHINPQGGRDHWPQTQSILLAGAGITGGATFGSTDKIAAFPSTDPITPADLAQSMLHLLGVPEDYELRDQQGRPIRACTGNVIPKLLA
jgi:hypothetical protein